MRMVVEATQLRPQLSLGVGAFANGHAASPL